jgi:2'-5' RNA ligase
MSESNRVRAFLAVPASDAWIASAQELVGRLKPSLPEASWTRPGSWHLTLVFLGEIPPDAVARFSAKMPALAQNCPAGTLKGGSAVVFPSNSSARVLSVGFAPSAASESLERLARDAHAIAVGCIAPLPIAAHNKFHPHVTLARIRRPWPRRSVETFCRAAEEWKFPEWPVERCVLYESRLDPGGAVHTPLQEWPLLERSVTARA